MPINFTPDPNIVARKEVLDTFAPPADAPIDFVPATKKTIDFKPAAAQAKPIAFTPAPKTEIPAKPNLTTAFVRGAYAPFKPIVDAVPAGVEASIKGGEQLVSGMAAPFLSQAQRDKLQKEGKYTPSESPVKEFSQAAYSGIMAPLAPALKTTAESTKEAAKEAGVPDKVINTAGDVVSILMDAAGVAGIPGAKEAKVPEPVAKASDLPARASDELFKLSNRDEARRTEYVKNLKTIKDVPNETWERLYAQKDNPELPKTPEEQALYDKTIKPISDRSEQLMNELRAKGIDFTDTGAAPRRVKGMSPVVEKIYGGTPEQRTAGRKSISTFSPALAGRTMWALPGKVGERAIVYVGDDGKLFANGEPVGEIMDKDTKPNAGTETSLGKLEQATTAEIEGATKLQYHKNLLANEYLRVQSLERAKDASDFLDYLKKDPEFSTFAKDKASARETPPDWRSIPDVKAFEGMKFAPKMAEVIEDYMGNVKSPEEYNNAVMGIAKAAKMSIFMNPIIHMINATNMFATSKGLLGAARDLPNSPGALMRAIKSVVTQDKEYREMAKAGLSLPSMRNTARQFNEQLTRAMGLAIRKEPRGMAQLAKDWGYNSTAGLMKAWMNGSSKILWAYSDMLAMTRVNEYMARGLSREEAIRRTEQVLANYRVPSRVGGSRLASQALQNPVATMFGRYDYNRFANLTGMVKRAMSKDPQAWEARDQLLALAVMTTLGYTALDKWLQKETKSKNAHQNIGGYSSMIDIGKQLAEGRKSPAQAAQSAFAPGFLSTPIEAITGQNMYTGRPIAQRGDWNSFVKGGDRTRDAARMGFDIGRYAFDKFMPLADIDRLATTDMTASQFWASQLGAQIPSPRAEAGKVKADKYNRQQAKSAAKKRPEWVKEIQ